MLRATCLLLTLWALLATPPAWAGGEIPLPPGSHLLEGDLYASSRGFRDTVEFFRKTLARRGVGVEVRPVEKFRDVVYVRILALDPAAPFAAIHVVLAEGRTTIYIVRPGKPARGSSNGRTTDSGSVYLGSNPSPRTSTPAPWSSG